MNLPREPQRRGYRRRHHFRTVQLGGCTSMTERTIANVEADLRRLQQAYEEAERRLKHLAVENRLATEAENAVTLDLTNSLPILDEHIRALRAELAQVAGGEGDE